VLVKNLEGVNHDAEIYSSIRDAKRDFREYTGFGFNKDYLDPASEKYNEKFSETKIYELELPDFLAPAAKSQRKNMKNLKDSQFDGFEYKGLKVKTKLAVEGGGKYRPMVLSGSGDVYSAFKKLQESDRERFYAVLLDMKNRVIGVDMVSQGTGTSAPVAPNEVYKPALLASAASVIFVHSHPSGDPEPSIADKELTQQLVQLGELMGIQVLDHVIVGRDKYYSFSDKGEICSGVPLFRMK